MPIRIRLTVIVLALVALPMVFMSVLSFTNYQNTIEKSRLMHLQELARLKAELIESYSSGLRTNIEMAQNFYNIRKHLPVLVRFSSNHSAHGAAEAKRVLDEQLLPTQRAMGISDIMLTDTNGRIIYVSNPEHYTQDLSLSLAEIAPEAFQEGKKRIYISDVMINKAVGNRPEMLFIAPIAGLNDVPTGAIVFEMDMTNFYRHILDTTGLGVTGEILLGRKSGNEIEYLNPLRHDRPGGAMRRVHIGDSISLPIQKAVSGETGIGQSIDYRGKKVVAAWRYIPSLHWGLVAKIDTKEEFAIVSNLKRVVIMILSVILIMVSIITFSVAQSIARPIQQLTKGAEIIGSGNLDYRVGMNLKDEIGQLSRSFDKMTHDLKETTASRDELNREIEERKRVEEKTRQQNMVLQGINKILRDAFVCESEKELGVACLKTVQEVTQSQCGFIDEINALGRMDSIAISDPGWDACRMTDLSGHIIMPGDLKIHGIYGQVVKNGKSFFTNDPPSHPNSIGLPAGHPPLTAFLGAPLYYEGKIFGMVGLANREGGYGSAQLEMLESLTESIVQAFMLYRAEKGLRESEERFRVIAEASPVQISVTRAEDGTILFANPEYERAYGFAKGEITGHKTPDLYFDPAERATLIKTFKETGFLRNYEVKVKKLDDTPFWVSTSINPIRFAGEPALLSTTLDITSRKLAEKALELRTEELSASNEELTFFNRSMADRELRMIELKQKVNELCKALGRPTLYDVDFGDKQ